MTEILCFDCNRVRPEVSASHWGDGKVRCLECSDKRSARFRQARAEKRARATCMHCEVKTGGPHICEACCEHEETDHGTCLDCGKDCLEDRMAAAYDRAKGDVA